MTFLTRLPKQISLRSVYSLSSGEMELEYSWHIRFESACSATRIGVTHQGSRCIFWYHFRNVCTLPQPIRTLLSSARCVLSHGYDKLDRK